MERRQVLPHLWPLQKEASLHLAQVQEEHWETPPASRNGSGIESRIIREILKSISSANSLSIERGLRAQLGQRSLRKRCFRRPADTCLEVESPEGKGRCWC